MLENDAPEDSGFIADIPQELTLFDYLIGYVSQAIPTSCEEPSSELSTQAAHYLHTLTDNLQAPPPDLLDRFFAYVIDQSQATELPLMAEEVVAYVRELVLPQFTLEDFNTLDPNGVASAVVLFNSGSLGKLLEELLKLLKALKRAKEFEIPENYHWISEFRRNGPFKILALGDMRLTKNIAAHSTFKSGSPKTKKTIHFSETVTVPKGTIAVTAELTGFVILNTDTKLRPNGTFVSTPLQTYTQRTGGIVVTVTTSYSMLKGNKATFSVTIVDHFDKLSEDKKNDLNLQVGIATKYYALDL